MNTMLRLEHSLLAVEMEHTVHAMLDLVAPAAPPADRARVEIAPDENARAYELDLLGHQPSAEEGTSIHTYCRLGRAGNRLSVRINKFDVSQAKMGETGLAIALDDDAGEVDLHAP